MKGTEKQVKWAEDIMRRAIETLECTYNGAKAKNEKNPNRGFEIYEEVYGELLEAARKRFASIEDAKEVIENRNKWDPEVLQNIANEEVYRRRYKK